MAGWGCENKKEHQKHWVVLKRNYQESAFNGYHREYTDRSTVMCPLCYRVWRTKAAYVRSLPDRKDG